MANFLAIVEPDPVMRERFVRAAAAGIVHAPGMVVRDLACHDLGLVWAAHSRAPVTSTTGDRSAALVLGDAIDGPSSRRISAGELAPRVWDGEDDIPGPSDGYFVALQYSAKDGLRVWADILGFFPVYHWSDGTTTLVGSSPELFRLHPKFRVRLSLEGLAGVLLINGLVDNTSVVQGVRRLPVGHVYIAPAQGRAAREKEHYRIPLSHDLADLALDDLIAEFGDVMERVCRRQAGPDGRASILLSGGLDSRVIAACAQRAGCPLTAVTFGKQSDQDLRFARVVASALGLPHHVVDDSATAPVSAARSKAKWEHLACGFFRATRWGLPADLAALPQPVLAGYAMDFLAGPKRLLAGRVAREGGDPFVRQFQRQSRWGIGSGNIDPLLRTEGLAARLEAGLREHYLSFSPSAAKTQWAHGVRHRARYHLGGMAWQIAMVSWPALPVLDREFLGLLGAMPMAAMSGRRLETDILTSRFPVLASLPLDRNSHDTQPISPRLKYLLADAVVRRLPWKPPRNTFYYERTSDINSETWVAVRREAETERERVQDLLDPEVLRRLLPPPESRMQAKDAIVEHNGARLLLGFLLWSRECLR